MRPYSLTGTSLAVKMASTPGDASASRVSMERIRACGRPANKTLAWTWLGLLISPGYKVRPVTLPSASIRCREWPIAPPIALSPLPAADAGGDLGVPTPAEQRVEQRTQDRKEQIDKDAQNHR